MQKMKQSELADLVGISASYLNLIEHNRRRIGGKLLLNLAGVLKVEPSILTQGAEATLITTLREAAAGQPDGGVELDRVEDFAGRLPGWAQFLAASHQRIAALEHVVETLTDRLQHDPHLAASLHEVLSTVTAIRSTASILVDTKELEPEWRDRFHRNINEDSQRLAESAKSLVGYLDAAQDTETNLTLPQEEVEHFLTDHGFHFSTLEAGQSGVPEDLVAGHPALESSTSRALAASCLERYRRDAARMPLPEVLEAIGRDGFDPAALAARFSVDLAAMMRRLASLPEAAQAGPVGLVISDASGTLTFRKPIDGFPLPRLGAACPLWPLFQAFSRPMTPVAEVLRHSGRGAGQFRSYAIAQPVGPQAFDQGPLFEAHMLILPDDAPAGTGKVQDVGVSCRICPKIDCRGRREPSILADGF